MDALFQRKITKGNLTRLANIDNLDVELITVSAGCAPVENKKCANLMWFCMKIAMLRTIALGKKFRLWKMRQFSIILVIPVRTPKLRESALTYWSTNPDVGNPDCKIHHEQE